MLTSLSQAQTRPSASSLWPPVPGSEPSGLFGYSRLSGCPQGLQSRAERQRHGPSHRAQHREDTRRGQDFLPSAPVQLSTAINYLLDIIYKNAAEGIYFQFK